jgi:hypothetical protein
MGEGGGQIYLFGFAQLIEWPTGKVCINPQEEVLADLSLETQVSPSFFY